MDNRLHSGQRIFAQCQQIALVAFDFHNSNAVDSNIVADDNADGLITRVLCRSDLRNEFCKCHAQLNNGQFVVTYLHYCCFLQALDAQVALPEVSSSIQRKAAAGRNEPGPKKSTTWKKGTEHELDLSVSSAHEIAALNLINFGLMNHTSSVFNRISLLSPNRIVTESEQVIESTPFDRSSTPNISQLLPH